MVFWPESSTPIGPLPVVVFTHGWGATKPEYYLAWLQHIVRKGHLVIYPRYQTNLRTKPATFTPNALTGVRKACDWLKTQSNLPQPDMANWIVAGHSVGGLLATNLAVELPRQGLPAPKALLAVEPGKTWGPDRAQVPLSDLSQLPATMLLVVVTGENDQIVGERDGRRIFEESTGIPRENKTWLGLSDDDHGTPALRGGHRAPCAPPPDFKPPTEGRKGGIRRRVAQAVLSQVGGDESDFAASRREPIGVDALDYFGTWKLLDALCDTAFRGQNRDYALGGGPAQLGMGVWSDGTPVKPLRVLGGARAPQ